MIEYMCILVVAYIHSIVLIFVLVRVLCIV